MGYQGGYWGGYWDNFPLYVHCPPLGADVYLSTTGAIAGLMTFDLELADSSRSVFIHDNGVSGTEVC